MQFCLSLSKYCPFMLFFSHNVNIREIQGNFGKSERCVNMEYVFEHFKLNSEKQPIVLHDTKMDDKTESEINWHRNIEVFFCKKGRGSVMIDADTTDIREGDIFVVNSCSLHVIKTDSYLDFYCLIIDPDFCAENDISVEDILFESRIDDEKVRELFLNIVCEYKTDDDFRCAGIRSSVLSLVLHLARYHSGNESEGKKRASGKVLEHMRIAIGYIKTHYTENITIDKICKEVGISKYHFVREFKKIIGVTPVNYINSLRIEKAKKMLLSEEYKISEVQEKCGFENASYFTSLFRKLTGMSPSGYIKSKS